MRDLNDLITDLRYKEDNRGVPPTTNNRGPLLDRDLHQSMQKHAYQLDLAETKTTCHALYPDTDITNQVRL